MQGLFCIKFSELTKPSTAGQLTTNLIRVILYPQTRILALAYSLFKSNISKLGYLPLLIPFWLFFRTCATRHRFFSSSKTPDAPGKYAGCLLTLNTIEQQHTSQLGRIVSTAVPGMRFLGLSGLDGISTRMNQHWRTLIHLCFSGPTIFGNNRKTAVRIYAQWSVYGRFEPPPS